MHIYGIKFYRVDLSCEEVLTQVDGTAPWWFNTDHEHTRGQTTALHVSSGLDSVVGEQSRL